MAYSGKYNFDERMRERYVYMLASPPGITYLENDKPVCYIGETFDPFKRYQTHLQPSQAKSSLKATWINYLKEKKDTRPRLLILESTVSTYTHGDSLRAEKAWHWCAWKCGYHLALPGGGRFNKDNFLTVTDEYKQLINERLNLMKEIKNDIYSIQTHESSIDSIQPYYGFSLITNDGAFIRCSSRDDRKKQLKKYSYATKDWRVPKNPKQHAAHKEILKKRNKERSPEKVAKWIAKPIFREASSWDELKRKLWDWRWTIHSNPRGGILFDGEYPVPLKKIGDGFTISNLELRFGEEFIDYDPETL